jgi:precorrin-6x reductase
MRLAMDCQVASLRKVLPEQSIRIFIAASLPWAARVTEVDFNSCAFSKFVRVDIAQLFRPALQVLLPMIQLADS